MHIQSDLANSRAYSPQLRRASIASLVQTFVKFSFRSRYGRILKAVSSGAAARLLSSALTLISLPLAVRYLGPERYGVWATIATTVVWINLLDLGIANSLTNCISQAYALNDKALATRYFTNALCLTGSIAAALGLAFTLLFPRVNWVRLFNAGASHSFEVRYTIAVAMALMVLGLPSSLAGKVLAGYQELHRNNYCVCASALVALAGLVLGIALRVSMPVLFLMSVGCMTLGSFANLLSLVIWQKPWLVPRPGLLNRAAMRTLLSSGWSFFLIQVAGVVVFGSDNLVVSHYLGATQVTPYCVTWRLVGVAAILQSLLFPALWPAYAEAYAKGDLSWIRRTFSFTLRVTGALNLGCLIVFVGCGRTLIRIWAGPSAMPSFSLLIAMAFWAVLSGVMSAESCLLAALNRTRVQAVLSIAAAALNLTLSILLVKRIGSLGVIAATILSYLFVLLLPQTLIVRRLLTRELADSDSFGSLFRSATFPSDLPRVATPSTCQERVGGAFFTNSR